MLLRSATVFTLSGNIASKNVMQTDPLVTQNATCVAPMCNTKKQKLFDKNTQYHGGWQWIKNAAVSYTHLTLPTKRIV